MKSDSAVHHMRAQLVLICTSCCLNHTDHIALIAPTGMTPRWHHQDKTIIRTLKAHINICCEKNEQKDRGLTTTMMIIMGEGSRDCISASAALYSLPVIPELFLAPHVSFTQGFSSSSQTKAGILAQTSWIRHLQGRKTTTDHIKMSCLFSLKYNI